ncbi:MAG: SH3 domain-containing protein, partial [Propionibacteriaceae bacterium]|nr:SH3 domain-containing protein [Propionibacteriaceae bacterium]
DVLFSPNNPETTHKPEPIRQDAPDRKADRPNPEPTPQPTPKADPKPDPTPEPTPAPPAQDPLPPATGEATTTTAVNVRSGPGTSHPSVAVAAKGTTLPTTGKTSGGWTQVIYAKQARWISSQFLTTGKPSTSKPVGKIRTTANLYLRTGGGLQHPYTGVLPANSIVDTTGGATADYTEILHGGQNRWIATRYTAPVTEASKPSPAPAPEVKGTVYVTVGSLYVRATSAPDGAVVATVHRGDALKTTHVVEGDRLQVIHDGAPRWVFKAYTSDRAPQEKVEAPKTPLTHKVSLPGYDRLRPNAKRAVQHVLDNYPRIRTIGGWRSSSNYSSDHPNGRAIDVMIPSWSQQENIDYGWQIARDFAANAGQHKVSYIIWRQQIWNAAYPQRGWRWMEDRGSSTANHYDHVHVSFRD